MEVGTAALLAEVSDLPGHEARRLLLAAGVFDVAALLGDPAIDATTAARFRSFVERRRQGEPLQYIEGSVQFGPLELRADRRALIPRPETERMWEIATAMVAGLEQPVIVDLCTGSGNLALACKHRFPSGRVLGIDISLQAIDLARENAALSRLEVEFLEGDLFAEIPADLAGRVDLVVANPPYVAAREMAALPAEVRDHEPRRALVAGPAGTELLARIAGEVGSWLRPGGVVVCEIGESQGDACLGLFAALSPRIEADLAGRARYVIGCAPEPLDVH